MSRGRQRGEALEPCLLWEEPRKERRPELGRGTASGRKVGQKPRNHHSAPGPGTQGTLPASPTPVPTPTPHCTGLRDLPCWRRTVGKRAAGTSPITSWQPAGPPGPFLRPGQLRRSPSERAALLSRPWAPTGGQRVGGSTRHAVSLARRAASSSQGPIYPHSPGPEVPSGQAPPDTRA